MTLAYLMPQVFEPNRSRLITPCPEESDHLAKRTHAPTTCPRPHDQLSHQIAEQSIVRPLVYHKLGESFFREQSNILILRSGCSHVHARRPQLFFKRF